MKRLTKGDRVEANANFDGRPHKIKVEITGRIKLDHGFGFTCVVLEGHTGAVEGRVISKGDTGFVTWNSFPTCKWWEFWARD